MTTGGADWFQKNLPDSLNWKDLTVASQLTTVGLTGVASGAARARKFAQFCLHNAHPLAGRLPFDFIHASSQGFEQRRSRARDSTPDNRGLTIQNVHE